MKREIHFYRKNRELAGITPRDTLFLPQVYVDQTETGGVAHELHGAVDVQFAHDVGPVIFYCFDADA